MGAWELLALSAMTFAPAFAIVALACYRDRPSSKLVLNVFTAIVGFGVMTLLALFALHL
jgi:hypothetical protein